MTAKFTTWTTALIAGLAIVSFAAPAPAQTWPTKPVKILIPFLAGGTADTLGRIAAQKLSEAFGQQFVPENKAGASGLIAAAETVHCCARWLHAVCVRRRRSHHCVRHQPKPARRCESNGYTHIADFGGPPAVLLVHDDVPAKNLQEFVAYAKANPGKLNYGSPSPGSQANLAFALFQKETGIKLQDVAYRGASGAMTDIVGGHIQVTSTALTSAAGTISTGKVRALGVTSSKRVSAYPDIPTFTEQGFPLVAEVWFSLSGPKGMPADIVNKINAVVVKGFQDADARQRLDRDAIITPAYNAAEFLAFYKSENAKWGPLAKEVLGQEPK